VTLLVRVISNEDAIMQQLIIRLMGRAANQFFSDSHWSEIWMIVHTVNLARPNQGLKEAGNSLPRNFNYTELWGQPLVPTTVTVGEHSNRFQPVFLARICPFYELSNRYKPDAVP
jgi:hypothetical protein